MRSDPLDVPTALTIGRGTLRKTRQNLGWAIGYNSIALPIAAGIFEPAFGLVLRPEIAALSMSGSSLLVAVNALCSNGSGCPAPHNKAHNGNRADGGHVRAGIPDDDEISDAADSLAVRAPWSRRRDAGPSLPA
jgi:Cu2+-exporting ATPase